MGQDAAYYRRQAEFCRRVARKSLPPLAAEFTKLAENWTKLAEDLERAAHARGTREGPINVSEFKEG